MNNMQTNNNMEMMNNKETPMAQSVAMNS
jgi:hypothetical protein